MKYACTALVYLLINAHVAFAIPSFEDAFSPDRGATDLVIKTIGEAKKTIRVAAYTFTSHPVAEALAKAHARGVDVEVVMDESNRYQRYSMLHFLQAAGVPTRTNDHYAIMHNKFIVVDGSTLELGSFNFTKAAEKENAENILVIRNVPDIAADYTKQWERIWAEGAYPESKEAHAQ